MLPANALTLVKSKRFSFGKELSEGTFKGKIRKRRNDIKPIQGNSYDLQGRKPKVKKLKKKKEIHASY